MAFFVKGEKIVLRRDGTWIADGTEITHGQTRDLFFRSIHWDAAENKYYLEVGYERIFIEVEDTPYFVTSIERQSAPERILAKLSDFTTAELKAAALEYRDSNLYLTLSDGQKAKFLSPAYYDLLQDLQEDKHHYFISIAGSRVNLLAKDGANQDGRPNALKRRGSRP